MKHRLTSLARLLYVVITFALLASSASPLEAQAPPSPDHPIDVNTATQAELEQLPGIGATRAEAILQERARRPFRRPQDLLRVRGIGRKTLQRLVPLVTFGPSTTH